MADTVYDSPLILQQHLRPAYPHVFVFFHGIDKATDALGFDDRVRIEEEYVLAERAFYARIVGTRETYISVISDYFDLMEFFFDEGNAPIAGVVVDHNGLQILIIRFIQGREAIIEIIAVISTYHNDGNKRFLHTALNCCLSNRIDWYKLSYGDFKSCAIRNMIMIQYD